MEIYFQAQIDAKQLFTPAKYESERIIEKSLDKQRRSFPLLGCP